MEHSLRLYLKTIIKIFLFILSVLLLPSCSKKNAQLKKNSILVSEPLLNRINDNEDKHDQDCIGFYTQHFPPSLLNSSFFNIDSLGSLEQKTGLRWNVISSDDSVINFLHIFNTNDDTNRVAYIAELIESEFADTRFLSVGSDDGFTLWVNGDSVASIHKGRQLLPHDDLIPVRLRAGRNTLLFKVDQSTGDWALYRKFISMEKMESILLSKISELYRDIPECCILPDTATYILLNPENGRSLDSSHILHISWKEMNLKNRCIQTNTYLAYELPEILPLPNDFSGKTLFEVIVLNKSGKIEFREEIPIFYAREADRLARRLTKYPKNTEDPVYLARLDAVVTMFNLNNDPDAKEYSTRMKAHALLDLYRYELNLNDTNPQFSAGPRVWGYRSPLDNTIQPYRLIIPASLSENPATTVSYNIIFIIHGTLDEDTDFWKIYQIRSHYHMAVRTSYSTCYKSIIVMPYGRGIQNFLGDALEEIPIILKQLQQYWNIDTTKIAIYAHSNAPRMALSLLQLIHLPVYSLGFWSPILPTDNTEIQQILLWLKKDYPDLKWYIWQGEEDEEAPVTVTRSWIKSIEKVGFEVVYNEEPHSTHLVYLGDPLKEYMELLKRIE